MRNHTAAIYSNDSYELDGYTYMHLEDAYVRVPKYSYIRITPEKFERDFREAADWLSPEHNGRLI